MKYFKESLIIVLFIAFVLVSFNWARIERENVELRFLAVELQNDLYDVTMEAAAYYDLLEHERLVVAELTDSIAQLLVKPDVRHWKVLSNQYFYKAADEGRELEKLISGEAQKKLYELQESYAWQYTALKEWIRDCCGG